MNSDDHGLVKLAAQGDKQAMEQLFSLHFKPMFRFVYSMLKNSHEAEDIVSETFLRAFEKIRTFKFQSSFKVWLYSIAKNLTFDRLRKVNQQVTEWDFERETEKETAQGSTEDIKKVEKILQNIPEKYAGVLRMRFLLSFTVKETAEALGISLSNAKVIQNRALKKAREFI